MPGGAIAVPSPGPATDPAAQRAFAHAESLRERGRYPEAIAEYQEGLRIAPNDRTGLLGIAETFRRSGDPTSSIRIYDGLLESSPDDVTVWRARAEVYRTLRNPPELLYSLTAITRLDPADRAAQIERSQVQEIVGEIRPAYDSLHAVLRTDGAEARDAGLYVRLGDLAARVPLVEEAEAAYREAVEIDPTRASEVTIRRVRLLIESGRPDLALERMDAGGAVSEPGAHDVAWLLLRAEILSKVERPAEARAVYEELLRKDSGSAVAVAGVAHSLMEEGKHSEARDLLRSSLGRIPRDERLVLLLAEAESGLGNLDDAASEVRHGLDVLPDSVALWMRSGEIGIAREKWDDAADAFGHAVGLDPGNASILLRAGFVAERRGQPAAALALYERAVEVAPHDPNAWTRRGVALLAARHPDPAVESFEHALRIDPESDAAKDGLKVAGQKRRELAIDRQGIAALRLESELGRPVTKNDLFVHLRVPFEQLDPVLAAMGRTPTIEVYRLPATELAELETASVGLVSSALARWPGGIEQGALTLADVASLSPAESTLDQVQRLFSYMDAVLRLDVRPENLELTPDVEELARQAMAMGRDDRTLFELVRDLRIGLFKARLIRAVERGGATAHVPLPALSLGGAAGEPTEATEAIPAVPSAEPHFFRTDEAPVPPVARYSMSGPGSAHEGMTGASPIAHPRGKEPIRCIGCGGVAAITHVCGAPICAHCASNFRECPKCRFPVDATNLRIDAPILMPPRASASHPRTRPALPRENTEPEPPARAPAPRRERATSKPVPAEARSPRRATKEPPLPKEGKSSAARTGAPAPPPAAAPPAPSAPDAAVPRPPRRVRTDEEPRL